MTPPAASSKSALTPPAAARPNPKNHSKKKSSPAPFRALLQKDRPTGPIAAPTIGQGVSAQVRPGCPEERLASRHAHPSSATDDAVDPLSRALALPPHSAAASAIKAPAVVRTEHAPPLAALDELALERLVRRMAWGGDGRKGSARIELGAGELAGATLTIHAEGREVSVELELPPGVHAADFGERIAERLKARGLSLRQVSIR